MKSKFRSDVDLLVRQQAESRWWIWLKRKHHKVYQCGLKIHGTKRWSICKTSFFLKILITRLYEHHTLSTKISEQDISRVHLLLSSRFRLWLQKQFAQSTYFPLHLTSSDQVPVVGTSSYSEDSEFDLAAEITRKLTKSNCLRTYVKLSKCAEH